MSEQVVTFAAIVVFGGAVAVLVATLLAPAVAQLMHLIP